MSKSHHFAFYSCDDYWSKLRRFFRLLSTCHIFHKLATLRYQQAGTGPNRRHIQGSKIAKRLPSVKYSLLQYSKIENFTKKISKKLHTQKNGPSGAPGPASASPWRAKVSQCRKTERGTLWGFQHTFCRKTSKN